VAAQASVKFTFTSPYEGGTKTWSTRLHVTGGNWQDQTHFNAFSDAVWTDWKSATDTHTTLVSATGYNGGSDLPVFSKSYNQAGTYTGTNPRAALEMCILIRFTTTQRSSRNHPIYLYNWIHCVQIDSGTTPEVPLGGQKAAWTTRATSLVSGYSDGTLNRIRCGPNGAVAQSGAAETYLHHRDFPT
jgi:hypothetical protein